MAVNVTSTQRTVYTLRNEGKSDSELQLYIMQLAGKIQSIPPGPSRYLLSQAEELMAEAKVCEDILASRKSNRDRLEQAHKEWERRLPERRYAAILNLKEAATPNGQLIAAILEDEGSLSEQEISTWCEELAAMDRSVLHDLLNALVTEGVLDFSNNKYRIRRICTDTLFPDDPIHWAFKQVEDTELDDEEKAIVILLAKRKSAVCEEDFPGITQDMLFVGSVRDLCRCYARSKLPTDSEGIKQILNEMRSSLNESYVVQSALFNLKNRGILQITKVDKFSMFYFPMLGERKDN